MASMFSRVRTIIMKNPRFVTDVPPPQARGRSRKKHRSKMRQSSSPIIHQETPPTSVLNNDLTTPATMATDNNKSVLPALTHSELHQHQPPPASSQEATGNHSIPVVLETADFPVCDDEREIESDDGGKISSDDDFSSWSGCTPVNPPGIPNRNRNQKTRREAENSKKAESSFAPASPLHAQPQPHIKSLPEQKQKKRRHKRKCTPSELEGTLPVSSKAVSSSSAGTVRHLKSSSGPLFTLLVPSPAPSASTLGSSSVTSRGYNSTAFSSTIATTTSTKRRRCASFAQDRDL